MPSFYHITHWIVTRLVLALALSASIVSCKARHHIQTQLAEKTLRDTMHTVNHQYDSIYIHRTSDIDRTRDTITITHTLTEYRYRLLRDTIYRVRCDSIPYEVRITETQQVRYTPPWIRRLALVGAICIILLSSCLLTRLKRS